MRFEQHKSLAKIQEYAWRIYQEDFDRTSLWRYFKELKQGEIEEKAEQAIQEQGIEEATIPPPKEKFTPYYSVAKDRVAGFRAFEDVEDRFEDMRLEWEMENESMSLTVAAKAILSAERTEKEVKNQCQK